MNAARIVILLCVCCAVSLLAQSADEQYVRIYQTIQEADRLNETGQKTAAAARYLEAQEGLRRFQSIYPGWNERVINYRLNYVATKLGPLATVAVPPASTNVPAPSTDSAASLIMTNVPPRALTNETGTLPSANAGVPSTPTRPAIPAEVQQQLASLQSEVERLKAENSRLGARLKEALSVQPAAADPRELARAEQRIRFLEKENDLLKVKLRSPGGPAPTGESAADLKKRLDEQADVVAALRAENEVLRRQRDTAVAGANPQAAAEQAQLLSSLRARVAVIEAKPVPYSPEELALMSRPPAVVSTPETLIADAQSPAPAKKPSKQIPPGAGPLVAAAERAFAARDYAEAERKYLDVLRQDENNVSTLANLASTQLEMGKVAEAEKHVTKALSLDPEDYFALYVLGRLHFRQDKLDQAIEALSRSARVNPDYAESQNYLGIALSEKGLRVPAETALRRAVQLQPNHAAAHNNLAVVYATQMPPAIALARWHYQKALNAGHPRNPELEKLLEEKR